MLLGARTPTAPECDEDLRIFASPAKARKSPPEKLAYVVAIYAGTGIASPTTWRPSTSTRRRRPIRRSSTGCRCRTSATNCTTSAGTPAAVATAQRDRRYLIIPGLVSGRIHIVDTADPAQPKLHKVIEPDEVVAQDEADRPAHRPLPGRRPDHDLDARRREAATAPGGFLLLDDKFEVAGRWEARPRGDEVQLRLLVSAPPQRDGQQRVGRAEHRPARVSNSTTSRPASTAITCTSGTGTKRQDRQEHRPRREGADPAGSPLPPQPGQHARLRRRRPVERDVALVQGRRRRGRPRR